jgi:hypothetical protein
MPVQLRIVVRQIENAIASKNVVPQPDGPRLCGARGCSVGVLLEPSSLTVVEEQITLPWAVQRIVEDGRHLFVATGLGTSILPVRFRVPPAVAMLTVTSERLTVD